MKFRYMVWVMLLVVITGCGGNSATPPKKVNAPIFTLPQYEGKGEIKLSEKFGKPVVLNFWSTT